MARRILWPALLGTALAVTPFEVMKCGKGAPAMTTASMTRCEYNEVVRHVVNAWASLDKICTGFACPQAHWAGCVLRVAGHDFMDFEDGIGGSDGCTDLAAADNAGLQKCIIEGIQQMSLNNIYQGFCTTVSLADFFVIAAEAVMMAARHQAKNVPAIDFAPLYKFGRTTATVCPEAGHRLPNPEGSCGEVERIFVQNMRLSWREAAALSGVHTLGKARFHNSGYDGWWSEPNHARMFDNKYFEVMLTRGWMPERAVRGNPKKNQWQRSDSGSPPQDRPRHQMMLNTDLCLVYGNVSADLNAKTQDCCTWVAAADLQAVVDNSDEHRYCGSTSPPPDFIAQRKLCCQDRADVADCPNEHGGGGRAYGDVFEFAVNDAAWIAAFMPAWAKATENGFSDLKPLGVCPNEPGTTLEPGSPSFDCSAGAENWQAGWSDLKMEFCCKVTGVGCRPPPAVQAYSASEGSVLQMAERSESRAFVITLGGLLGLAVGLTAARVLAVRCGSPRQSDERYGQLIVGSGL